jgi:hypothetical protein
MDVVELAALWSSTLGSCQNQGSSTWSRIGNSLAKELDAIRERASCFGNTLGQYERLVQRATAHLVHRFGRNPFDLIENA